MTELFECECGDEGMGITVEGYEDEGLEEIHLSFWSFGQPVKSDWSQRLRYIWRIIRTGRPYGDMVILSSDTAREMVNAIWNHLPRKYKPGSVLVEGKDGTSYIDHAYLGSDEPVSHDHTTEGL